MIKNIMNENENILPNDKEMQILKENFPACFKNDGSFDIERFKEYLSDKVHVTNEGYELKFLGKNYARLLASMDTTTVITPDEEHNNKPENKDSENIYISGDNIDGLKHLLKSYSGQIKCIYIDPPYNTGSDGFVYNDFFNFTAEELSAKLSIDEEQAKRILDLTKRGSSSHSAWLMFMYPRLLLARDLLTDDGVIFISIDDNEQSNLKLLCDDIFGEENIIGQISVVANPRGRDYGGIARMHDYIIAYRKSEKCEINLIDDKDGEFTQEDELGGFELRELRNRNIKFNKENRPNLYYPFYIDTTHVDDNNLYDISIEPHDGWHKLLPLESQGVNTVWRWGKDKSLSNININIKAKAMKNGSFQIVEKYREARKMARSVWWNKDTNTEKGTLLVKELFDGIKVFDYPKPIEMLSRICQMATNIDKDDIILDFFSGSASMAHSVMQYNIYHNTNHSFIMIQLPESVNPNSIASTNGYKTIDQIGIERIIRASKKIKEENPDNTIDLGFKHYTLTNVSESTLDKLEDFKPEAQGLFVNNDLLHEFGTSTILTTWIVHDGYGFNGKVEEVDFAGYKAYWCNKHLYLINPDLSKEAIAKIIEKFETNGNFNPENVVLFGYSFLWSEIDELKINLNRLQATEKNLRINYDVRY